MGIEEISIPTTNEIEADGFITPAYALERKTESLDKDINVRSKTEPQTEKPKIRKRIDKPFRAVWLDDDHNEIGTPQTDCPWQNDEHIPTELASTMLKNRFKEQK